MLRDEKDLFLDSKSIADLENALGVKVHILPSGGGDLVRTLLAPKLA